jgi:copper homeostasis protein (lipoprotein)
MKYFCVILFLTFLACNNKNNSSDTAATDTPSSQPGFDLKALAGVFHDTLPCTDCDGIAARLYLRPDNSFVMEQAYLGKSVAYDIGKWSVVDSILKLTGNEGPRQFKILNLAEIKLLDNEGRMPYDTANTRLTLKRDNTPFKPAQPVPLEGIFSAAGDTMNIQVCAMGNTYPVALAPAAMQMKALYNKAVKQENEPLYAKLAGHFELRPSLTDTTTEDFFVVERFVNFVPGQQCK